MIDLHSHLLPGVDDGSGSIEQSSAVLARMAEQGITQICLTPHLAVADLSSQRLEKRLARDDRVFHELVESARPSLRLHRGVELMLDESLPNVTSIDRRISIARSRYVLVEFPRTLSAFAIRGLVSQVTTRGMVPVIAHPERYSEGTVAEVNAWRDLGAAVQVDASTIAENRSARGKRARDLIEAGLADILAADNHGDDRTLATAAKYLTAAGAYAQRDLLLTQNPLAILEDRALDPVAPIQLKRSWIKLFARAFHPPSNR